MLACYERGRFMLPLLLLCLLVAPGLAACGSTGRDGSAGGPATLNVGSEAEIPPLDPHRTTGTVGLRVIDAIFDPLIREDLEKRTPGAPALAPALAESWTASAGGRTYTLRLRSGVTFQDGTSFDSAAVEANFDRLMDERSPLYDETASGNMTFLTNWISSTSAPDPQTFVIRLKEPFAGLPRLLTDRRMSIVSPKALKSYEGNELGSHPVGTGPFQLERYSSGQALELKRNGRFWGSRPGLEKLTFRPIPDPTTLATSLQTGEVDAILSASSQQVRQLSGREGFTVQYPEPANSYFIRLNTRARYTDNADFRRALNFAVNRDAIATLLGRQVSPLAGPIPRGNEAYENGIDQQYRYDPEQARKLIAAAGVTTPVALKLLVPNSGPGFGQAPQVMSLIQQDLKQVGVDVRPEFLEFATLLTTEGPGYKQDVQGSLNGWTTGASNADFLERMFSGEQLPPNGVNRGYFRSSQVDALFGQARGEGDQARRNDLYRQAAARIGEAAPWVFLYQDRLPRIFKDHVTGVAPAASVYVDWTSIRVR